MGENGLCTQGQKGGFPSREGEPSMGRKQAWQGLSYYVQVLIGGIE